MKKWYVMTGVTLFLCVACTVVFLVILPDTIPAHFGLSGQVDRYGSKFELLICPGIVILLDAFLLWWAKKESKKEEENQEKEMLVGSVVMNVVLLAVEIWQAVLGFKSDGMTADGVDNSVRIICAGIGVVYFLMGILMLRSKRNSWFSFRLKIPQDDDVIWRNTQYKCGMSMMTFGMVIVVFAMTLPIYATFGAIGVLSLVWVVFAMAYPKVLEKQLNK